MAVRSNALASYGRVASTETNPLQQIVMLYDGAIKFLYQTASDIESNDIVAKAEHSNRAIDIISYLQSILDFERGGDVATTLDNLYTIVLAKILRASAMLDAKEMRAAADLLAPVREAWAINAKGSSAATTASAAPSVVSTPLDAIQNSTISHQLPA